MSENITELLFKTYGTVLPEQSSIYLSCSDGKPRAIENLVSR